MIVATIYLFKFIIVCLAMIDSIIAQLQSLLANVKNMESRYLSEVLSLQKIMNHTLKASPYIPPKDNKQLHNKQQKSQPIQISVEEKVKALMNDIQIRQKNIQNQVDVNKHKFQIKPPQVILEKKPPIPTGNRNQKAVKNQIPMFVPPKSRNQVTGKVTQTIMRTSAQKVFKPERTSQKKLEAKEDIKAKVNPSKERSVEKKVQKKESKLEPSKVQIKPESVKSEIKPQVKKQATSVSKQPQPKKEFPNKQNRVKFATFQKQVQVILSQLTQNTPKNHKKHLQKLINDLQIQQKGHRMHEDNNRRIFIKKANNYAASRHAVYPMSTFSINRQKWCFNPKIKDFTMLLDSLLNELEGLQLQKDCRIDKKKQYKIHQSSLIYSKIINQIRSDTENSSVPQKLDLTFTFAEQHQSSKQINSSQFQNISEVDLNNQLLELLEQISQKGTLQRNELRGLQTLAQVGMFRSKRSPVLLMRKEYNQWKDHYTDHTSY